MSRVVATIDLGSPGRSIGHLLVPHSDDAHAYSYIPVPIAVVAGAAGPTVLLVAGTHGDEWEGQIILRDLLATLEPEALTGRIILLPSVNLPAVRASRRCSPLDGENLNRAFPGDADGGPTRMLADYAEATLLPECDYAMDLHSGGSASEYLASAFLRIDDDARRTTEKIKAAEVAGLPYTFVVTAPGEERTFSAAADRTDVVMVATELAGCGRVDLCVLRHASAGVRRVLAHWGLLGGGRSESDDAPTTPTRFLALGPRSAAVAKTGGLLEPLVRLGDVVAEGDVVARVHGLEDLGATPEPVRCPTAGVVGIVRTPPHVRPGDVAASIGVPVDPRALTATAELDGRWVEARSYPGPVRFRPPASSPGKG